MLCAEYSFDKANFKENARMHMHTHKHTYIVVCQCLIIVMLHETE